MPISGFDNHWMKLHTEVIRKEERARRKQSQELRSHDAHVFGEQAVPRPKPRAHSTPSSAMRFLEEQMGLESGRRPSTREGLYSGVSHDEKGRALYLRNRRKYDVAERYGMPVTESQWYGYLTSESQLTLGTSENPSSSNPFFEQMASARIETTFVRGECRRAALPWHHIVNV
eukprot:CAMPEP_0194494160 /NCGR_PEP_ID=MMETSP0253-20130528/12152_1 /TAXON_ID=2966 /ORGANISM="Noctiluca scintillans" /LENGTH=172 /DNA_ID=CAMNT_0039335233 /DNA_START=61 /DNA_END=577 /DNA_ORIENTATION=-